MSRLKLFMSNGLLNNLLLILTDSIIFIFNHKFHESTFQLQQTLILMYINILLLE